MTGEHFNLHEAAEPPRGCDVSRRAFLAAMPGAAAMVIGLAACEGQSRNAGKPTRPPARPLPAPPPEPPLARPPIPTIEPTMRVRIHHMRPRGTPDAIDADLPTFDPRAIAPGAASLVIGESNQWIRVHQTHALPHGALLLAPITVRVDERGWSVIDATGFRPPLAGNEHVEFVMSEPAGAPFTIENRQYPGSIHLIKRSEIEPEAFDVVNHVPLETYLPGVLARELYNSWHLQTHAAQAIAARSFACAEQFFWSRRRHFDVTNTQASQVYGGLTTHRTSLDAVAMTRGLVMTWNGKVVPGYYSSCCGGRAARASDAISTNVINEVPPLDGRSGTDVCATAAPATVARWSSQQSVALLTRRLVAYGEANPRTDVAALANLVSISTIEVAAMNEHGRPTRHRIVDERGEFVVLSSETLRRAGNYAGQGLHPPPRPMRSGDFTAVVRAGEVHFEGLGFGHGAGMCQHGAEILARQGRSHREIVEWYYPRAEIVRAY